MSQLAAYALNPPANINLAALEQQAQGARQREHGLATMESKVALENKRNSNALAKESSLEDYRIKAEADDPTALDELKGFPDEYKKIAEVFDGMDPEDWLESKQRATVFGEAARKVSSVPEGPARQKIWDATMGELMAGGHIDKTQHDAMVSGGPSEDIINQALTTEQFVAAYSKRKSAPKGKETSELERARIKDIDADNTRQDRLANSRIEKDKRAPKGKETAMSAIPSMTEGEYGRRVAKVEQLMQKFRAENEDENAALAEEERLNKKFGLDVLDDKGGLEPVSGLQDITAPVAGTPGLDAPAAEEGDIAVTSAKTEAGTAENPHRPATRAEAEALPSGAYFLAPNGKLIRKK
jgi:hypothetical protein